MGRIETGQAGLGGVHAVAGSGDPGHTPDGAGQPSGHAAPETRFKVDADISTLAALLGRLQELLRQDPAQARRVLTGVAALLRAEGGEPPLPGAPRLAARFQEAAETGSLDPIQPARLLPGPDVLHRPHGAQTYGDRPPLDGLARLIERALELAGVA